MRGVFFKTPVECSLEVQGDAFSQGDTVVGTFRVRNRDTATLNVPALTVSLAHGSTKKIKAKEADAFSVLSTVATIANTELAPDQQVSIPITIPLQINSPIFEKNQSLYLIVGNELASDAIGALLVTCIPHPHIRTVIDTLTTVFGFTDKGVTWKDNHTSYKLKAPTTRKLSLVDELLLSFQFVDDSLSLSFYFKVKSFDTSATSLNVKRGKIEVQQSWSPGEYLFGSGLMEHQFIENQICEALAAVSTGF
jgi:hypothetical protein